MQRSRINDCKNDGVLCDFRGTIFPWTLDLHEYKGERGLPPIDFSATHFIGDLWCNDTVFDDSAVFIGASFYSGAIFETAEFSGNAYFTNVSFKKMALFNYSEFKKMVFFDDSTFEKMTEFCGVTFGNEVSFRGVNFLSDVDFSPAVFHHGDFYQVNFHRAAYFRESVFSNGSFKNVFIGDILEFDQSNVRRLSLVNAPIEKMRFIDCKWPKNNGRSVVFDSRKVGGRGYFKLDNVEDNRPFGHESPPDPSRLADVFRRLKKIASDARDEPLASDWHYAEKEMQRRAAWKDRKGFWAALGLYRVFSGYGEAPLRAGLWLLFLLALPVALYLLLGDQGGVCAHPEYCLPWSSIDAEVAKTPWPHLGFRLYQVLVVVQAGLFGFATRNKMRR